MADELDLDGEDARIVHIALDERNVIRRSPEVEQERAIAVYDLLEDNRFRPSNAGFGPYHLHLRVEESRLIFDVRGTDIPGIELHGHDAEHPVRDVHFANFVIKGQPLAPTDHSQVRANEHVQFTSIGEDTHG